MLRGKKMKTVVICIILFLFAFLVLHKRIVHSHHFAFSIIFQLLFRPPKSSQIHERL